MKKIVLEFLSELRDNNNREWFQQNKQKYDAAKKEMEQTVNLVIPALAKFDPSIRFCEAKDCMFRIFRDVRFARDKSPYKVNMGAWMTGSGRKASGPGYYMHVEPGGSFFSAGIYMPDPDTLKKIRKEVYYNIAEFKAILADKNLRKYCNGLEEIEKVKTAPRDFPKEFPDIDILKHKHYILTYFVHDEMVASDHYPEIAVKVFKLMHPMNLFLKRALE